MKRALVFTATFAVIVASGKANAEDGPLALPIHPVIRSDADLRFLKSEDEGENGFRLRRMWLGAWAQPTPWLFALATFDLESGENAPIVDAYVTVIPDESLRLTVGQQRTPLFATARTELEWTLPIPELTMPTKALWPGRDFGAEAHWLPKFLPLEAWFRVGNGSGNAGGNDNNSFAIDARLDAVVGRARAGAHRREPLGLRVGIGIHGDNNEDRGGVTGQTVDGFVFYRAPVVAGGRTVTEAHAMLFAGPTKITAEGGVAQENRLADTDGNVTTPRVYLDPVTSFGGSVEVAWMVTGQQRLHGTSAVSYAPTSGYDFRKSGVEIAVRAERLSLAHGARDVAHGGATGEAAAITYWATSYLSWSLAGYRYSYDSPPLESPGRTTSWVVLSRVTLALGWPDLPVQSATK